MDVMKSLLLVCLLALSLLAQCSLTAPIAVEREDDVSPLRSESALRSERVRRMVAASEQTAPALLADASSSSGGLDNGFLTRMRRSLAQMQIGIYHYRGNARARNRRLRRLRHRHRSHRRHRGRVVDA